MVNAMWLNGWSGDGKKIDALPHEMKNRPIAIERRLMFTLKIDTDQPNGIFENGQHIQPFVLIDNHSDNSLTGQLMWRVTTDTGEFLEETTVTVHPTPPEAVGKTTAWRQTG
jgi:hypothetical protein